jgi:hypothetical protein
MVLLLIFIQPQEVSNAIELSICSPSIFLDFKWSVHDDLCGSDHYPIVIHVSGSSKSNSVGTWKLHKADWGEFVEAAGKI